MWRSRAAAPRIDHRSANVQSRLRFLKQWVRNPRELGSITPSSRYLTREVVDRIDFSRARYIAELGPGTGVFTQAILDRLAPDGRMLAIDTNAGFVEHLRREIPDRRLQVVEASAERVDALAAGGRLAPRGRRRLGHPVLAAATPGHARHPPGHPARPRRRRPVRRLPVLEDAPAPPARRLRQRPLPLRAPEPAAGLRLHLPSRAGRPARRCPRRRPCPRRDRSGPSPSRAPAPCRRSCSWSSCSPASAA